MPDSGSFKIKPLSIFYQNIGFNKLFKNNLDFYLLNLLNSLN
jgi:hypothetical protein